VVRSISLKSEYRLFQSPAEISSMSVLYISAQATYYVGEMCGAYIHTYIHTYIHLPRLKKRFQWVRCNVYSNCPANMNERGAVVKRISGGTAGF
jgi:hypothetical protein